MDEQAQQNQQPPVAPPPIPNAGGTGSNDVDENKGISVLAYISILFLIPMLAKKDSPYAQFHAKQGMVLFITGVIIWVLSLIPVIGWFIIGPLGTIFIIVLAIMGIINALQGKQKQLPLIGGFAGKI